MSLLCYYAVQQIALGDAMALVFSAPLFTLFLEWVFISSEENRPKAMILIKLPAAALLLAGVVLILQPSWLFNPSQTATKTLLDKGKKDNSTLE